MQISGRYCLNSKSNTFTSCSAQYYSDNDVEIYIASSVDDNFASSFASLYKEKGVLCVEDVEEMFLAVVSDFRDDSIHIVSDITTSALNMYYAVKGDVLFYSTSLKYLLLDSNIERSINLRAAKAFIANGYVFGCETLLENVYKMRFGCEITVHKGEVVQRRYPYEVKRVSTATGKKALIPTIQEAVVNSIEAQGDIYMPLSGGFDSNIILNLIRKVTNRKIHAFTVGGKGEGKNEIGVVKDNIAYIDNIELHESYVDTSFYDDFSDIVWRLEGSVFESGVFLQYALARTAQQYGADYLICGEGSDEVQNVYYYDSLQRAISGQAKDNERFFIYSDPFIGTNMLILKKSSLMLNSFGIVGKYPFKNRRVSEIAISVSRLNGTNKKFYKKLCRRELVPQIANRLKTTGGTTKTASAINASQIRKLTEFLSGNELLAQIEAYEYPISTTQKTKSLRHKQYLQRGFQEIRNLGLFEGMKMAKAIRRKKDDTKLLKQAYIVIFQELFASGKHDESFQCEEAPLKTNQIIKG